MPATEQADPAAPWRPVLEGVAEAAERAGLDPGPVDFQMVPARLLETVTAYGGLLTRLGHWSFGKAYYRLRLAQQYRELRLYELVVPTRPAVAYLLNSTPRAQTRLVMAHVLAHADFFRHHVRFAQQPPDMARRTRIWREWMEEAAPLQRGRGWEAFLDDAAVLADLIDPYTPDPTAPQNVLLWVARAGAHLTDRERHALAIVEQQARFMRPALETKIANEGWATWWHRHLVRDQALPFGDVVDAAELHAQVVAPGRALNPYALGLLLWERAAAADPERPWRDRHWINDAALIDRYLDESIAAQCLSHVDGSFATVKTQLLAELDNGGIPRIELDGVDAATLQLVHRFDGRELDASLLPHALGAVSRLWGGPAALETRRGGTEVVLTSRAWDGEPQLAERIVSSAPR